MNQSIRDLQIREKGFEIQDDDITDPSVIRDWCRDNLKEKIKSNKDPLLKKASKWCVNYQTIEEIMGDTFETNPTNLANKYDDLDDDVKELIAEIVVTNEQKVDCAKIKEWCDTNKKRRSSEDEEFFESKLTEICMKVNIGS
ncbi:hypothetical protein A6V39_03955 [Candidatus Mycoplasma haematobovis]|uniref:Uncharacterized protein n=1 Tax=Candidatus Mycoplasma haematobovis TaxID=432608 RepID=A0A1A9QBT7_9MOLU|nr:hypothetical protein [Candidatus Mycoplasma haematobovis]OAL10042.1 hypothetical protein A6V39_03955 [Candidatus Mycoplasma haematobovis]